MLETDYLIVGSGAVGMAFADTLLSETNDRILIVDKQAKPGGHWLLSYPFVTLHQPSMYYGVSSTELGNGTKDTHGLNKGLYELSSGARINAYYDEVMNHRFLASGRVQYFPLCEYVGDNKFKSLINGMDYEVNVKKKIVDAGYLKTTIPATHTPGFVIDKGVKFMPINNLINITEPPGGFVVIGAGKTGVDACLWLLENNVDPDMITWIMPRDSWFFNRVNYQSTEDFFEQSVGAIATQFELVASATSVDDLYAKLEAEKIFMRIDKSVTPTMFHGATMTLMELEQLQRIKNIVRMGRIKRITPDSIILDKGTIPTSADTVHIDCSASGISKTEIVPVFNGNRITLQCVIQYQTVASGSFIAHVEAAYDDEAKKNELCKVIPLPSHGTDWIKVTALNFRNKLTWNQDKALKNWFRNNRLDSFSKLLSNVSPDDEKKQAILKRMKESMVPAFEKLQLFSKELV